MCDDVGRSERTKRRPEYRDLAADLVGRLPRPRSPERVPAVGRIARLYRIPVPTAEFVRRAAVTLLRRPPWLLPQPPGSVAWLGVAADLRERIEARSLRGRIPGRRALAEAYGVSLDVVNQAVEALIEQHLLVVRPGSPGTYVNEERP
ncbi:GntR family transcriptional regulator [Kitasatospora sp. NPDC059408]|uniref:GntR family transcriptional regulator n=1 Tax=Kitasatospora sp. NPDC059408 TaxID=3346823 RepID=UPI003678BEA4